MQKRVPNTIAIFALNFLLPQELTGSQKRALQRRGTLAGIQADNWAAALDAREPLLRLLPAAHRERFAPRRRANQPPTECVPLATTAKGVLQGQQQLLGLLVCVSWNLIACCLKSNEAKHEHQACHSQKLLRQVLLK